MTFAGMPPATQLSGSSLVTAAPAATTTLFPIETPDGFIRNGDRIQLCAACNRMEFPCVHFFVIKAVF